MKDARALKVTTPSDREIVRTRTFEAPRLLVWKAMTEPDLMRRWMFTPLRVPYWAVLVSLPGQVFAPEGRG